MQTEHLNVRLFNRSKIRPVPCDRTLIHLIPEVRYHKNLAKLKSVISENKRKQAKGKKYEEGKKKKQEQKKLQMAMPGFEPAPQLPLTHKVRPNTTGPCDNCTV